MTEAAEVVSTRARLGGFVTFRVGSDCIRTDRGLVTQASRDPRFFDPDVFRPFLRLADDVISDVRSVRCPSLSERSHRICALLEDAEFRKSVVLHEFGFCCIFFFVDIRRPLDTDDMLLMTNALFREDMALELGAGLPWSLTSEVGTLREWFPPGDAVAGDLRREYSMIHIVDLAPETRELVSTGQTVYQRFEREFHALSVRVLENWRDRYPAGVTYAEPNASVSPAGVLRVNARNVLFYEYPYNAADVEQLYYPALTELRLWDLMTAVELLELRALIRRLEHGGVSTVGRSELSSSREAALRIASEFEALSLCTSKRTRNLYRVAFDEFGLGDTLRVLRDRASQVEDLLSRLQLSDDVSRERQLVAHQRELAFRAQTAADAAQGFGAVLRLLGVMVGLQVALDIAVAFSWSKWARLGSLLAASACLVLIAFVVQRTSHRRASLREEWTEVIDFSLERNELYRVLSDRARSSDLTEVSIQGPDELQFTRRFKLRGWLVIERFELEYERQLANGHWQCRLRGERFAEASASRTSDLPRADFLSTVRSISGGVLNQSDS